MIGRTGTQAVVVALAIGAGCGLWAWRELAGNAAVVIASHDPDVVDACDDVLDL